MKLYLIYFLIIILTFILFLIIKDKRKAMKLVGILTISSSILLLILSLIIKIILNINVTAINISNITSYLFLKFVNTSLILLIIGIIEIIISKNINHKKVSQE